MKPADGTTGEVSNSRSKHVTKPHSTTMRPGNGVTGEDAYSRTKHVTKPHPTTNPTPTSTNKPAVKQEPERERPKPKTPSEAGVSPVWSTYTVPNPQPGYPMMHSATEEANELPSLPSQQAPQVIPKQKNPFVEALTTLGKVLSPSVSNLTEGAGTKPNRNEFKKRGRHPQPRRPATQVDLKRRHSSQARPRVKGRKGGNAKP